jgi:tRNA A-37 threonylcarbamoyl transferase component Bud32
LKAVAATLDPHLAFRHDIFMTTLPQSRLLSEVLLQKSYTSPSGRIAFFRHNGCGYWVKRPESLGKFRRLQKGDADKSFQREVSLLKQFRASGAAVVPIAAETTECVILPDMGPTVHTLSATMPAVEFGMVLERAAQALADLHKRGLCHGRPRLRDICWTGSDICFLDLEAGAQLNAPRWRQALDLLLMVHSVFHNRPRIDQHVPALLQTYAQAGQGGVLALAQRMAHRLSLLRYLARPLAARDARRGKTHSEAQALIELLEHFR